MESFYNKPFEESDDCGPMFDYERQYRTYNPDYKALLERIASTLRVISLQLTFLIGVVLTYIATHS